MQTLTPLALLDRLAAPVLPPRVHRYRHSGVHARTAAHGKFPGRLQTAGVGRVPSKPSPDRLQPGRDFGNRPPPPEFDPRQRTSRLELRGDTRR